MILAALCAGCGSSGAPGARPASPSPSASATNTPMPAPEGVGAELSKLAAKANGATYRVRYRSAIEGRTVFVTLYRKPPNVRQDLEAQGSSDASSTFLLPDGSYRCVRRGTWTCTRSDATAPQGSTDPVKLAEQLSTLADLSVTDRRIAGADARCFTGKVRAPATPAPEVEVESCITADGVPLLHRTGGARFEAESFSLDVPDSVFALPAPPSS